LLALQRSNCACIILAEGNSPEDELLGRAAEKLSIPTVCIQQGWSPIIHSGFRNMRYDAMCVWGDEFARLLQPANPSQHFVVTGSHNLHPRQTAPDQRKGIGFFLQNGSRLISTTAWQSMLDFASWTATEFPDRPILVREHPGSPLTSADMARLGHHPNMQFVPSALAGLSCVLAQCRVAVSMFSTTLIEAVGSGVIPLIFNLTGMPRFFPDLESMGAGVEVKTSKAAQAAISRLLGEEGDSMLAKLHLLQGRFFARSSTAALDAICDVISTCASRQGSVLGRSASGRWWR
jgi:hypothetical protein